MYMSTVQPLHIENFVYFLKYIKENVLEFFKTSQYVDSSESAGTYHVLYIGLIWHYVCCVYYLSKYMCFSRLLVVR